MTHKLSKRAQQFIRNSGKRPLPEIDPRFPPFVGVTPKRVPEAVFGPVDKLPDDYEVKKDEAINIKIVEERIDGQLKKVKKRIIKKEGQDTVVYSAYYNDDSTDASGQKDIFGRNGMLSMLKHIDYHFEGD